MEYRNLGRTGVKVSPLCLGTMNFGGHANEQDSAAIINHALDAGIDFIDTANVYGHDPANFQIGRGALYRHQLVLLLDSASRASR